MKHQARYQIERYLLACCIVNNSYISMMHIVQSDHFTNWCHQSEQRPFAHIMKAIEKMNGNTPIDSISIIRHFENNIHSNYSTIDIINSIQECTSVFASDANLQYHALILLQINIYNNLITQLKTCFSIAEIDTHRSAILEAIKETENMGSDQVFNCIDSVIYYFQSIGMDNTVILNITNLKQDVNSNIDTIKQNAQYTNLLHLIRKICPATQPANKMAIERLINIAHTIGTGNKSIGNSASNLINTLEKHLYA